MQKITSIAGRLLKNERPSLHSTVTISNLVAQRVARVVQTAPPHRLQGALEALFRQHGLAFDDAVLRQFLHHLQPPSVTSLFEQEFLQKAQNKTEFHKFMVSVFGAHYDQKLAESLRQRALHGDFSWLPYVKFVDDATLQNANGAYDAKSKTVLLNKAKLSNKNLLQQTFVEEVGHHLDAKLNVRDTRGDEGEMFRRRLSGEVLSPLQVQAIRSENDHGVLTVNGKKVEVEFFLKAVVNVAKGALNGIKKAATTVAHAVGKLATGVFQAAAKLASGALPLVFGGLKIVTSKIAKTTGAVARGIAGLCQAVGKKVWSGVTYPYRKIKNAVIYFKNKTLKLAEEVAWLKVGFLVKSQLAASVQIDKRDRAVLRRQIVDAMKTELKRMGKYPWQLSKNDMIALAYEKSKEILNPYIQGKVSVEVIGNLPEAFNDSQKQEIATEVVNRLGQYISDHDTSWFELAGENQLAVLVQNTTQDVLRSWSPSEAE